LPSSSAEIEAGANRAMEAMSSNMGRTEAVKRIIEEEVKDPKLARTLLLRLEKERVIFDPFGTRLRRVMRGTFNGAKERKSSK
jgi:hypothetical protein